MGRTAIRLALVLAAIAMATAAPARQAWGQAPDGVVYVVKTGDTLESLAERWLGGADKAPAIAAATLAAAGSGLEGLADQAGLDNLVKDAKIIVPVELTVRDPKEYVVDRDLNFPEAPFWSGHDQALYYVEWGGDKIWRLKDGQKELFIDNAEGDGPCGLDQDADGNLWVALYTLNSHDFYNSIAGGLAAAMYARRSSSVSPNDSKIVRCVFVIGFSSLLPLSVVIT
jgi:hypothetical protein